MTCSHDVIGLASGSVRIPLEELTMEQRIRLFWLMADPLKKLLNGKRGMSGFIGWKREWEEKSLDSHALWRYSLQIPSGLEPSDEKYSTRSRIHPLACEGCRLPNYDKPKDGHWVKGEETLTARICLRDDGALFLEKYTGKVTRGMEDKKGLIKLVTNAEYIHLERLLWAGESERKGTKELSEVFDRLPSLLYSCLFGLKDLVRTDREAREVRVRELKETELEMDGRSRIFGIH